MAIDLVNKYPAMAAWLEECAEVAAYLWERGWAERNAGNLSVDVSHLIDGGEIGSSTTEARPLPFAYPRLAGRCFLVTGTGRRFRDVCRDTQRNMCVLRMSAGGDSYRIIWGGDGAPDFKPTSEFPSHLRVHEYLRESSPHRNVVLHTHPTELIALSHLPDFQEEEPINRALWGVHPEVKVFIPRGVGLVRYMVPGTEALALATVAAFRKRHVVVLWQKHGCIAVGSDVLEAFDLIDTLNKGARIILLCKAAGGDPQYLTVEQLEELKDAFGLKA
jgi:rhamnulose-1-phosphate aldolase